MPLRNSHRYGITNFRVITVTPTKQCALNHCQKLQKSGLAFMWFWVPGLYDLRTLKFEFPADFRKQRCRT